MLANLPLPPHYQPEAVEHIFRVPYEQRAVEYLLHDRRKPSL